MELKEIKKEELINVLNEYIRDNYTYNYADIFEDSIVYYLENGEQVFINIDLETENE